MQENKKVAPTKFLWVDLEMTGLRPTVDVIQEVAAIVTDADLNELARYEAVINQPREVVEKLMAENPWFLEHEANRQAFLEAAGKGKSSDEIEQELMAFVADNFGNEPAILAGNSIHNDRNFIRHWWPNFERTLHYRMLDVSAWKVFMQARYGIEFVKQEKHRALGDIGESIAELRYYLDWFKDHTSDI